MQRSSACPGVLALLAGLAALALSVSFLWVNRGVKLGGMIEEMPSFPEDLIGPMALAVLFQYGTPVLCGLAFLIGFHARRGWAARAGMLAAVLAAATYLLVLQGWIEELAVVSGAGGEP